MKYHESNETFILCSFTSSFTKVELGDYDENLMMYEIKSGLTKDDYIVWASDDLYEGEPAQTWDCLLYTSRCV